MGRHNILSTAGYGEFASTLRNGPEQRRVTPEIGGIGLADRAWTAGCERRNGGLVANLP